MATCSSLTSLLFGLSALAALCMARPVSRGEFIFTNVEFQSPLSPDHVNLLSSLLPGNTNLSSIVGNNNYSSSWWSDLQHEQRWDASVCTESSGSSSSFCKVLLTCNYLSAYNSARDTFTALGQNDSGLADMANKMDAVIKCLCGTWVSDHTLTINFTLATTMYITAEG